MTAHAQLLSLPKIAKIVAAMKKRVSLGFIEGKGWKRQPCPDGTAYSADHCACSVSVAHGSSDDSSSSSEEDSHSWSQQRFEKGSRVSAGYGDSSSVKGDSSWNTASYHKQAVPCTRKATHDKSSYAQFIEGRGWITQPCPDGTAYSADDCACSISVAHGSSDDSSSSSEEDSHSWSQKSFEKGPRFSAGYGDSSSVKGDSSWNTASYHKQAVPCTRKATHDKSSYAQFIEGWGWITQPCPKGTAYNADDCACSVTVAHGESDDSSSSSSEDQYY
ncbi:unnamed protein product [Acanthosepion pharaonis]|uniref:Uncharacterized protein n=1 Tax=Acanthosepion pharaonis TaxID=158019 RepID=A0A812D2A2_ACAPH|nr:unnamed protein product [Sepia pharaonis]